MIELNTHSHTRTRIRTHTEHYCALSWSAACWCIVLSCPRLDSHPTTTMHLTIHGLRHPPLPSTATTLEIPPPLQLSPIILPSSTSSPNSLPIASLPTANHTHNMGSFYSKLTSCFSAPDDEYSTIRGIYDLKDLNELPPCRKMGWAGELKHEDKR